jgi:hypothetical protein
MFKRARNLEFEQAAKLRDEIDRLKQLELGFPAPHPQLNPDNRGKVSVGR